ncbi:MAG: DNRLRE domain-containing protein [Verrucomicrobiota bacterium]
MIIKFLTPAVILTLLASPLFAGSVTLTPEEDTDVYQFTTYPTSSTYSLGVNVSSNAGHSQRSLVRFPVTAASSKANADSLASATLRLYVLPDATTGSGYGGTLEPGDLSVFTQGQSWSVATARWSRVSPDQHLGDIEVTKASTDAKAVWIEFDATDAVRSWLSGTANHGFVIQGLDEAASRQVSVLFASMETGFPPELVITTDEEPPPPPDVEHTRPTLQITGSVPTSVTQKFVTLRGKASGSDPITQVRYQIGDGPIRIAAGTKNWKIKVKLAKGKNRIRVFAKDETGDTSKIEKLKIRRTPQKKSRTP